MANILDDLGKKLSEAGKSTLAKTRELSSVSKLNSAIRAEERTQESLFTQLGKEYFNLRGEEVGGDFADIVREIRESRERSEELQAQINDIRGIRSCPECDAEVPLGAIFCNICGVKLPEYEAPEREGQQTTERCPGCGREVDEADKFCPTCGTKIERKEIETVENAETISAPEEEKTEDTASAPEGDVLQGEVVEEKEE
ncbi:MAG: zinc ribbon domain-containing protein [Lachnospiraceae bacterium]|nr:zinc ribbon domain-containing protein [Lachnospiraceae bacterium]